MSLCILIPTFPKYRTIADHTKLEISKYWAFHPNIYLAGCENASQEGWLSCSDEKASWMSVLHEAVVQLLEKKQEWVYLILDDHPPLGQCNAEFLNQKLPEVARNLDATVVNLLGCDQGQGRVGEKMLVNGIEVEHCAQDYPYRFSLHPALWNLEKLKNVLESSRQHAIQSGLAQSPWTFEKTVLENQFLSDELKAGCYRISGSKYSARKSEWWILRRKWKLRMMGKRVGLDIFSDLEFWYEGPYPMIWSGMMRAGKVSDCYERVLKKYGDKECMKAFNISRHSRNQEAFGLLDC